MNEEQAYEAFERLADEFIDKAEKLGFKVSRVDKARWNLTYDLNVSLIHPIEGLEVYLKKAIDNREWDRAALCDRLIQEHKGF